MAKKSKKQQKAALDNFCKTLADKLIAEMESGSMPWRKEWTSGSGATGGFFGANWNGQSGRPYQAGNALWLAMVAHDNGWTDPRWLTMAQAKDLAGYTRICKKTGDTLTRAQSKQKGAQWRWGTGPQLVAKGAKATEIMHWAKVKYALRDQETGEPLVDENGDQIQREFWSGKIHKIFNWEQFICPIRSVEKAKPKVKPPVTEDPDQVKPCDITLAMVEALKDRAGLKVSHGSPGASYAIYGDTVRLPSPDKFTSPDAYAATLCHELIHWSGSSDRLDREGITRFDSFGTKQYAFEELVAEMGAVMLSQGLGLSVPGKLDKNHAAYLRSWIKGLKDNPDAITRAATLAKDATTWILDAAGMLADIEAPKEDKPKPKKAKGKKKAKKPGKARTPKPRKPAPVPAAPAVPSGGQMPLFL